MNNKILCFGDSNTWGTSPTGGRYNNDQRWSDLLAKYLSEVSVKGGYENYSVIEAGQPNRTLVNHFPFSGNNSGVTYLKPYLLQYQPKLVLIMLGTNDLKKRFNLTVEDIALAMEQLVEQVLNFSSEKGTLQSNQSRSKVMIIAPPPIYETGAYVSIYQGGAEKSQRLAQYYAQVAKKIDCYFFDAGSVVKTCVNEGIHWNVKQHQLLAQALSNQIIKIFALP